MPAEREMRKASRRLERLIFLPVVGALIVVWGVAVLFKVQEHATDLAQARTQLGITVSTLADFSELAEQPAVGTG